MLNDQDQIIRNLKRLHMPTIRRSYEEAADRARSESWSYEQYLLQLLLTRQLNIQFMQHKKFLDV